ncbi:hypothetical protein DBR40_00780 [Pedobacter sp. KBW01]|uniref:hypothetical protein n=1 Tax=Pedobacter sp. KBW01 TaxID=2153364 RepID=UPI000F59D2C9|nr:hypothetical protein [Pedobacter sp. KBW01]RQO80187.1 hypothetical protein DBR40_00780 [Pedobacter sp. KBW01]
MLSLIFCFHNSEGQTTTIDFTKTPQMNSGTYDPNYWSSGGCGTYHRFGPNPLPVDGHNVRTVGGTNMSEVFTNTSTTYQLSLYCFGNTKTGQRENVVISVEYPFLANKTYLVEINGNNDHDWNNWVVPVNHYNGVFWVKLENSPNIVTNTANPCEEWYTAVEKSVNRYSKLIADRSIAFENKNYTVKFSPLENKSALKIIFDSSPIDPKVIIDNIFRLKKIKITEMPYEEDGPSYTASYTNVPRPRPWTPAYEIPGVIVRPTDGHATPTKRGSLNVATNQWVSNGGNLGYSIYLSEITQNVYVSEVISMSVKGDLVQDPRGGRPSQALIALPGAYQGNNYTYQVVNGDILINVTNSTNTPPTVPVDFDFAYN